MPSEEATELAPEQRVGRQPCWLLGKVVRAVETARAEEACALSRAGLCAEHGGVETTDQGAGFLEPGLFFSSLCFSLPSRGPSCLSPQCLGGWCRGRQPSAGKGKGTCGPCCLTCRVSSCPCAGSLISPAHAPWWLPNGVPHALKGLRGPCSEPGQSPREITAVRHGEGERASRPACNYDPRSAHCRSPIN